MTYESLADATTFPCDAIAPRHAMLHGLVFRQQSF